jgi:hypothetical protein
LEKKNDPIYFVCWMLMIETTLATFFGGNSELKVEGKETGGL